MSCACMIVPPPPPFLECLGRSVIPVCFLVRLVFRTPFESILILFSTVTAQQPHEVVVVADLASFFQAEPDSE